jgi:hypothetical protein
MKLPVSDCRSCQARCTQAAEAWKDRCGPAKSPTHPFQPEWLLTHCSDIDMDVNIVPRRTQQCAGTPSLTCHTPCDCSLALLLPPLAQAWLLCWRHVPPLRPSGRVASYRVPVWIPSPSYGRCAARGLLLLRTCCLMTSSAGSGMASLLRQGAVLCCAVLCCAVLCCAVLCCAVLCCAVLCCVHCSGPGSRYRTLACPNPARCTVTLCWTATCFAAGMQLLSMQSMRAQQGLWLKPASTVCMAVPEVCRG